MFHFEYNWVHSCFRGKTLLKLCMTYWIVVMNRTWHWRYAILLRPISMSFALLTFRIVFIADSIVSANTKSLPSCVVRIICVRLDSFICGRKFLLETDLWMWKDKIRLIFFVSNSRWWLPSQHTLRFYWTLSRRKMQISIETSHRQPNSNIICKWKHEYGIQSVVCFQCVQKFL